MQVYLIKRCTMGGSGFMPTAYADAGVCQMACDDLAAEWAAYKPLSAKGEEIEGSRVIVDTVVYALDKTDATEALKARALKKLTKDERSALGI